MSAPGPLGGLLSLEGAPVTEEAVEGTGAALLGGGTGALLSQSAACTSGDLRMFCMTMRNSSNFGTLHASQHLLPSMLQKLWQPTSASHLDLL